MVHHGARGYAATLAEDAGIADLAVSLTHEGDVAAAVVVALCRSESLKSGAQAGGHWSPG